MGCDELCRFNEYQSAEQSAPEAGALGAVDQVVEPLDARPARRYFARRLYFLFSAFMDSFCPVADELPKRKEKVSLSDDRSHSHRGDAK